MRVHNDPRPALKSAGTRYVYALLHAHQLSTLAGAEPGVAAMVSRSGDGELIVPILKSLGIKPVRGSNRRHNQDKGGIEALGEMIEHVNSGKPAYLAVDGPRGPRNQVRKGIAALAKDTSAAVLVVVAIPTRRWIVRKAWDRIQIPKPFCTVDGYFGEPLTIGAEESVEEFRKRIEQALNALESQWDPNEATWQAATQKT